MKEFFKKHGPKAKEIGISVGKEAVDTVVQGVVSAIIFAILKVVGWFVVGTVAGYYIMTYVVIPAFSWAFAAVGSLFG